MAGLGEAGEELVLAVAPSDAFPYRLHGHPLVEALEDVDQRQDEALHDGQRRGGLLLVIRQRFLRAESQFIFKGRLRKGVFLK